MWDEAASPALLWRSRWTPGRLIVVGAFLGFLAVGLDAAVGLASNLALLHGALDAVPYGIVLLDAATTGFLVPIGLFMVLCGIALHLRAQRPPGRSVAFRAALSGAALHLAAGLILGVLTVSLDLLPPEVFTVDLVRNLVLLLFVGTVGAALGLLVAFCGIAALVRQAPAPEAGRPRVRVRSPLGKSIYRRAPSAR